MTCEIFTYSVQFLHTFSSSDRVGLCPNINLLFYIVSWIVGPCKCTSGLFWLSTIVCKLSGTQKKWKPCIFKVSTLFKRAADGNRTRDLRTTNATLYRLSHSSITWLLTQSPWFIVTKQSIFVNTNFFFFCFFCYTYNYLGFFSSFCVASCCSRSFCSFRFR